MSAPNPGRQSPPPEEQSGAQQSAPSSGHGVNEGSNSQKDSKDQLENLSSNPKGPLDDHVKEAASKTMDPSQSSK